MKATYISSTPDAEELMVYIARESSPKSEVEKRKEPAKLLRYCMRENHWSVFEHAHMTVRVQAPRWLTRQLLRHRSFSFSEFSQRYAEVPDEFFFSECRMQDDKNRQNSLPCDDAWLATEWRRAQEEVTELAYGHYQDFLRSGVAKEVARNILPEGTYSSLCMTGNARSWIHFAQVRRHPGAQKEIRMVTSGIIDIFKEKFPICAEALEIPNES